eukprot:TRINITY_DN14892_c0_g1_i14.p1 TRINITY_DN14892_c0_g1~~TRINITY_DN14892_c0_g1_i14.p1  ORF type:complete len:225 (+),score=44.03 TRINITY_DN14892_c0_g1_i14:77-751(+)
MIRRPPRSTLSSSSAASDVYKRQISKNGETSTEVALSKGKLISDQPIESTPSYTLTWWHWFVTAGGGPRRSVLHYGTPDSNYPKSPSVVQLPSTLDDPNTRLSFTVSHTKDPDFHCNPPPQLPVAKWSYIALAVEPGTIKVYYDGELVCTNSTDDGGTTTITPDLKLYLSDPFRAPAFARLDKLTFYQNEVMKEGMLKAMMQSDGPPDKSSSTERVELQLEAGA